MTDSETGAGTDPAWLHPHVHEPNPAPPSADATFVLSTPDGKEVVVAVNDLNQLPMVEVADCYIVSTGHGTSGPFTFGGVRLVDFLNALMEPGQKWTVVDVISSDGFGNRVLAEEALDGTASRPILLVTKIDGKPMSRAQGVVRLVVPMEKDDALRQVKWIEQIQVR